jgi:predicted dehydrogenase
MTKLRGGITGCGFFAQFQIEAWRRMSGVELVAAADPDLERAGKAAPKAYASLAEMLDAERLDFVDIATRPDSHLALTRTALERGVPVICQKPLAPTWAEAKEIAGLVKELGVPFMVHENWRWQPWFREVALRIKFGDIGKPITYLFRTRRRDGLGPEPYMAQPYFRQMPRLLIYETLIHQIDTARMIFGDVASVYAETRRINPLIAGEDLAYLVLSHASGLAGCVDGNRFAHAGIRGMVEDSAPMGDAIFEGEQGVLMVDAAGDVFLNGERVWENTVRLGYRGDSVLATQQHFIDELRGGRRFESSAEEYLRSFGVVEAAYRSAAAGARYDLGQLD